MGKTEVALEYVYRNRYEFDHIFWLGAQRPHDLALSFAKIAMTLKIPGIEAMDLERRIETVKEKLESCSE